MDSHLVPTFDVMTCKFAAMLRLIFPSDLSLDRHGVINKRYFYRHSSMCRHMSEGVERSAWQAGN